MNARLRLTCAGVLVVWVAFTCWFYVRFLALEPDSALAQIPSLLGSGNDDESDADKILLVVIQTEPEGIEIRNIFRSELSSSPKVRLAFLVNGAANKDISFHQGSLSLTDEQNLLHDMWFYPPDDAQPYTEEAKHIFVKEEVSQEITHLIILPDTMLLNADFTFHHLKSILHDERLLRGRPTPDAACLYNKVDDIWTTRPLCSFGSHPRTRTLYEWIAGKCESSTPMYYINHTGPAQLLSLHARRVYIEYRRTNAFCREAWHEIAIYNKLFVEILDSWTTFAERHSIRWFITGSVLLGAELQQGFMPYDPDLSIVVYAESLEAAAQYLVEEQDSLPFMLERYNHPLIKVLEDSPRSVQVTLPSDLAQIEPYFKIGCAQDCRRAEVGPALKLRHKRSCYESPSETRGGYPLSIFIHPPNDLPPYHSLETCLLDGLKVPCPPKRDEWLQREFGANWRISPGDLTKVYFLRHSDPLLPCEGVLKK